MKTSKDKAINLYNQDPAKALMFCKKWKFLGEDRDKIVLGAECIYNGSFYSQLGYNVEDCIDEAIQLLGVHLGII